MAKATHTAKESQEIIGRGTVLICELVVLTWSISIVVVSLGSPYAVARSHIEAPRIVGEVIVTRFILICEPTNHEIESDPIGYSYRILPCTFSEIHVIPELHVAPITPGARPMMRSTVSMSV